jgi:protein-tyrosine phosphatase
MKYGVLFATVAVLLVASALLHGGWRLLLLWPAVSFGVVAIGYLHFGPIIYGKSSRGVLSPFTQLVLLPYLLYLWSVWYALRLVKREPAFNQLTDSVFIGRRLLSHELPDHIDHVVDLTCEFSEPNNLRSSSYHLYPILDGFVPSPDQLRQWVQEVAALPGTVFIHCAEGHGRTGLFAAALLLTIRHSKTPDDALQFIRSKRPMVRLGRRQLAVLNTLHEAK